MTTLLSSAVSQLGVKNMEDLHGNQAPETVVAIVGPVADQLLDHLENERISLEAMLSAIRSVHVALRDLNDEALQSSLEAEARELACGVALQERRRRLQNELGAKLHIPPHEITLRRLITLASGSVRDSIERIWRSLSQMAAETDRLNKQNAVMIGQSLSIARGVVERITGASGISESYGASGARTETHVGPLIQWGA
jgi:hypothetical protein